MEKQKNNNSGAEASNPKVKLMCSYGGKIQPRPHDRQLTYVGGDTKILSVHRNVKFSDFFSKLNSMCNCTPEACVKYQLPGEDLDALVSLIDDDDVAHMMVEYDRMHRISTSWKPPRLRLFIFSPKKPVNSGIDAPLNPDFLFGFDKDYQPSSVPASDLLLIPSAVLPEISGSGRNNGSMLVHTQGMREENHVTNEAISVSDNPITQFIHRVPTMASGYQVRSYGGIQGVVMVPAGFLNGEQPVYSFVPEMPSIPEQKSAMANNIGGMLSREVKVNQLNF